MNIMFTITILIAVMAAIVVAMIFWALSFGKKSCIKESNTILSKFEPDNDSPTLTQMIDFHKQNGVVEYEL